jgi:glucose/arabinose dehydrogenase
MEAWPGCRTAACSSPSVGPVASAGKDGVLDPTPISGRADGEGAALSGLMDVVLHPRFAENHLVYLTYNRGRASDGLMTTALARGRLEGTALMT